MSQSTLIQPVLKVCSLILLVFGLLMSVPLFMANLYNTGNSAALLNALFVTVGLAAVGWLLSRSHRIDILTPRKMLLITTTSWLLISLTGALPFMLIPGLGGFTDAVFESVSGLTTTGSTVLVGLDGMAHDILLWRSMLQWVGGLGVIGMAVAILPF
ncbi:MAG: trk system potassium uptake protein TrkH [Zhongshania sp.]|jgi:trk system potassium uptake protein TrkH